MLLQVAKLENFLIPPKLIRTSNTSTSIWREKLIAALNSGEDVFKTIAANWKNISVESVSSEERQQAKKICYGMIYGMSSNTLCQQLNTTKDNAIIFMETFKNSYPGLNSYFQSVIKKCVENGYVSTLMQRRRYLPLINSKCKSEKAHAERQAVNTTIQGSAADLIKSAMIKIEKKSCREIPRNFAALFNTKPGE
ncbi:DNA polymerase theta [Caerostris extrusa]|uniref:DNA-directed DNA polymerase n=1 Tax=Caerostris extrusa TaxID=172846 RepID=A0AAV4VEB6_CAEEX|nr:DNA polymerase theta [Caerostris extrusa]